MVGTGIGQPKFFPAPDRCPSLEPAAFDERLDVPRMLDAYRHGLFPWPVIDESRSRYTGRPRWIVGWYSPDPRAVLPLDDFHVSRRLQRKLVNGHFRFRWNADFEYILQKCATLNERASNRWLSPALIRTLTELNSLGIAHSIEVYHRADDFRSICGGLYGIASGGAFAAESMFHLRSDASKASLYCLVSILKRAGFLLLDIQQQSKHLAAMGAVEISRDDFLRRLAVARELNCQWPASPRQPVAMSD